MADTESPSSSPEIFGPEIFGPEIFGPEIFGPEIFGPETFGPETFGPETFGEIGADHSTRFRTVVKRRATLPAHIGLVISQRQEDLFEELTRTPPDAHRSAIRTRYLPGSTLQNWKYRL